MHITWQKEHLYKILSIGLAKVSLYVIFSTHGYPAGIIVCNINAIPFHGSMWHSCDASYFCLGSVKNLDWKLQVWMRLLKLFFRKHCWRSINLWEIFMLLTKTQIFTDRSVNLWTVMFFFSYWHIFIMRTTEQVCVEEWTAKL